MLTAIFIGKWLPNYLLNLLIHYMCRFEAIWILNRLFRIFISGVVFSSILDIHYKNFCIHLWIFTIAWYNGTPVNKQYRTYGDYVCWEDDSIWLIPHPPPCINVTVYVFPIGNSLFVSRRNVEDQKDWIKSWTNGL